MNSGLSGEYAYDSLLFGNTGSESLRILGGSNGSTQIDEFAWSASALSISEGNSIMFDGDVIDSLSTLSDGAQQNDNTNNWCSTAIPYGDGDNTGSPNIDNNSCTNLPVDNDNDTYYDRILIQVQQRMTPRQIV